MMPHPLLPMGLPPASVAMAMSQMNHLSTIANMAAAAQQIHTHVHRAPVIKGLLKVAVENARAQDKQIQAEKRELKMELYREREMRETSIQKRLKKEKKAKRKLQEALEFESKRRERVEDALKHSSSSSPSPEHLHAANNNSKNGTTSACSYLENRWLFTSCC
ncbi:hypothetical protein XENOCAPTIV_029718 [Xenoophorus captivus]|uniref:Uncharacterized protein n=1 Tax=Xenoophorus captivus TaxID=1517983 RepID=A0ABV0SAQ6_9TELE